MAESLRGYQGWAELEPPPDIRLLFDVEEVLGHHSLQGTKDLLGPSLVTPLDGDKWHRSQSAQLCQLTPVLTQPHPLRSGFC